MSRDAAQHLLRAVFLSCVSRWQSAISSGFRSCDLFFEINCECVVDTRISYFGMENVL